MIAAEFMMHAIERRIISIVHTIFELNMVISAPSHARWGAKVGNGYCARTRETRAHAHPFASLTLEFVYTIGIMLT